MNVNTARLYELFNLLQFKFFKFIAFSSLASGAMLIFVGVGLVLVSLWTGYKALRSRSNAKDQIVVDQPTVCANFDSNFILCLWKSFIYGSQPIQ